MTKKTIKTDRQWHQQLSREQYQVTRQAGTEAPFSGIYVDHNDKGTYRCICCQQALFSSDTKFASGCGWPSFFSAINRDAITQHPDFSHGMNRTEVRCRSCEAHLGHVFDDGPEPTGIRYCINSVALEFENKN